MNRNLIDSTNTIVIADFDGTFTKKEVLGKKTSALMTILMDEKYLGKNGLEASHQLFNHYYPIELDPHIGEEEKIDLMEEWWEKSFAVMRDCRVSREMLLEVCNSPLLQWRDQLLDFIKIINAKKIPLIIFSAGGFGKLAIDYLLLREGVASDNIKVFSNEIIFDEQGYFMDTVKPTIHIANKTGNLLVKNNLIDLKPIRSHCLLIGDSLDDAKMSIGIDFNSTYKVAFSSSNQEHFAKKFDLILPVEGSFGPIIDLIS
jgi:5'-nucleotidase